MTRYRKIVIVGGGFGGVKAALRLANKEGFWVRLISPKSYFEYHAALYRSATGHSPLEVAIPLDELFARSNNVEVVEDAVVGMDAEKKTLACKSGAHYEYDEVIFALGSVTNYFGIPGVDRFAYGMKSVQEALGLKTHLHEQLTNHDHDHTYVVIGGGASGIELAGELVGYEARIRRAHHVQNKFQVDLMEAAPQLVASLGERYSKKIRQRLGALGVHVMTDSCVVKETLDELKLKHTSVHSHTVVWTAGQTTHPFFAQYPEVFTFSKKGKVKVDMYMRAAKHIYVIGDCADTQYSGMAQTAIHDANYVADQLIRRYWDWDVTPYRPKRPVYVIPVGPKWAAVRWGNFEAYGYLGWLIRRLADLRLFLMLLSISQAFAVWHYGVVREEACPICRVDTH